MISSLRKTVWRFHKQTKTELPRYSTFGYVAKENKSTHSITTFIEALFTIAKIWKLPKCPSVDEWIKMWYIICTGKLFSHKKE